MHGWSIVVPAVAALVALSSCHAEDQHPLEMKPSPLPAEKAEEDAPRRSSPEAESGKPAGPDVLSPDAARSSLTSLIEGLDAAWYDPSVTQDHLELLCDHLEWETRLERRELGERTPCTLELDSLHVVDTHGTAPWAVHEQRGELRLVRAGAKFPSVSMPVLALIDPPAIDARLIPLQSSSPSARPKSVEIALAHAVAKIDERQLDSPMRPRFELHGAFGGNADTLVVFEAEDDEELAGLQVIAAFAGDQLEGVFGDPALMWTRHEVVGVTDLDGDGVSEVLWWAVADGAGVGLLVTWFADGEFRRTALFSCECADYFESAYSPRRRP